MVTKAKVWIADASHILWIEHICWSYLAEGFLVESIPLIINHQTRIREDIIELNQTIDLDPCSQNIFSISRTSFPGIARRKLLPGKVWVIVSLLVTWLAKYQRPAGVYTLQQVRYKGYNITRHKSVRKILQNICEQEKSYSLSKSSFSVLLLLISTLSLKLKLLLLFGFVYVLCNKSASHWKHKLSAVCAPKDLLPPIYTYLLDPQWVNKCLQH